MKVVVATVVHHPSDARIFYRQVDALLEAGHEVVYLAPFGDEPPPVRDGLRCRSVPRAQGARRLRALRGASSLLAEETEDAHVAVLHDPELSLLGRFVRCPVVVDVHEDLGAQLLDKEWIPRLLRGPARLFVRRIEARMERLFPLMLAEEGYLERFPGRVVVRNTPMFPPDVPRPGDHRLVYLGRVSHGRGVAVMVDAMRRLSESHWNLDLYGPVDRSVPAAWFEEGIGVAAHGFTRSPVAHRAIRGATAGLCLLRDLPNYRHSMPTKVLEYMANGVPVITTPIPAARQLVERSGAGVVVPFDDPQAVVDAVVGLSDSEERERCAENGRRAFGESCSWSAEAERMLEFITDVATGRS